MEIEEKLIIAKLLDKIKLSKSSNKIVNTEFLSIYQKQIIQKKLNELGIKNYIFFGGYNEAEGQILIIYPEKFDIDIVNKNLKNIIKVIKIKLPKELEGKYSHRDYLGSIMQLGLNRNRIGDIIVYSDRAYIIVLKENTEYLVNYLSDFVKFRKAKMELIDYTDIEVKPIEYEEFNILINSMRLDNFVSEIANISRSKAEEMLKQEKIYINSKVETKSSKTVKENDILVMRGKGKYLVYKISGKNKKGKIIVNIKKYK